MEQMEGLIACHTLADTTAMVSVTAAMLHTVCVSAAATVHPKNTVRLSSTALLTTATFSWLRATLLNMSLNLSVDTTPRLHRHHLVT